MSFPTAVRSALLSPSRLAPTAMFSGDPPTNAPNSLISSKGLPILLL